MSVVRECYKGDDESLWERGKFDPPPPKNPLADGHQNFGDIANFEIFFIIIALAGVSVLRMRDFVPLCTKFRARKCLLGVAKPVS